MAGKWPYGSDNFVETMIYEDWDTRWFDLYFGDFILYSSIVVVVALQCDKELVHAIGWLSCFNINKFIILVIPCILQFYIICWVY